MNLEFNGQKLATMVRNQRANRGFREIAEELGDVSASTLHRLEKGKWPDMYVFTRVCAWLNVSPGVFFKVLPEAEGILITTPISYSHAQVIELIRSDGKLTPDVANVLSALVTAAYQIRE